MIRIIFFLLFVTQILAQTELPIPTNFKKSYNKNVRNMSGLPGENYWQNNADYAINVNFSPETRVVSGTVKIKYRNNSPDTLTKIVFKLFPNLYQIESIRTKPIAKKDLGEGVTIESVLINSNKIDTKMISIQGTNMTLKRTNILPLEEISFEIKYTYILNKESFTRTGQVDSGAFVVAYFFPRIAVYDDIDGWDENPYLGYEEFYNDYGNFHLEITVPDDYQVWCTGNLKNPNAVFNDKYLQLIKKATESDTVINIINKEDITNKDINQPNGTNTWIFDADNVPDVAFTTSNHYIWKSSSVLVDSVENRRVRVDAVYNPNHTQYEPVVKYAAKTVSLISYKYPKVAFPYPHITIFEGLDAMEYPMMVNNLPFEDPLTIVQFTVHEVFHTLFPFYVGTNETKYSFMDEGLATMTEFTLTAIVAPEIPLQYDISEVNQSTGSDYDSPILTLTPQLNRKARFSNKDLKPALGFYYVKEMLGEDKFSDAIHYFTEKWKGKHPTPYDFFNCINSQSGSNLNWFWNEWFFNKISPDLAINNVSRKVKHYTIEIQKKGIGSVPIHLKIFYTNGTEEVVNKDISYWSQGQNSIKINLKSKIAIEKIVLGNDFDVDIDSKNNIWKSKKE